MLTVDACGQYLVDGKTHAVYTVKAVWMKPLWNSSEYPMAAKALGTLCDEHSSAGVSMGYVKGGSNMTGTSCDLFTHK
jgi:hypothetical protein